MEIKEKIGFLIKLQEKDVILDGLRAKAAEIPAKIEEEKSRILNFKTETEEKKKGLIRLQLSKKEKELELETKEGQIRKHSSELNTIKSNDTYKSLLTEIDNCKRDKNALENGILDVMEDMEKESLVIKENEKLLKGKESECAAAIALMEAELKKVQDEAAVLEAERAEYVKSLPNELLSRYDYIRESRQGSAVVPVEGENCGGCQMVLRPQIINEVCKNQEIITCDSCSRILFKK